MDIRRLLRTKTEEFPQMTIMNRHIFTFPQIQESLYAMPQILRFTASQAV